MSLLATNPAVSSAAFPQRPGEVLERMRADEPRFAAAGLLMALLTVPTFAAMLIDDRLFNGVNVWEKPLKFEVALAVYLLTLAFFARFLPTATLRGTPYRAFSTIVVACITLEIIWIGGAAANGTASHFNAGNPAMMAVYGVMGLFAAILTSASFWYGLAIRRNANTGLPPALHQALWLGLTLTLPLTLVVAGYMSSRTGHWVGGDLSDAQAAPIMGWARDGGDLRVAHFFATHAMHFVPAFGLAASALLPERPARNAVWLFAALFVGLVAFAFLQALAGQPFLPSLLPAL